MRSTGEIVLQNPKPGTAGPLAGKRSPCPERGPSTQISVRRFGSRVQERPGSLRCHEYPESPDAGTPSQHQQPEPAWVHRIERHSHREFKALLRLTF